MTDRDDDRVGQSAPALSVTVLNYNYAHYLPQCLDSILRQTFTDFELILINDCSTDNSLEVIQPYLADPRVKLVNHEQNKGYIRSLIEGSEMSRGKYITVISADDYSVSDQAFEMLVQVMESDADLAFAYSDHGMYPDDGIRVYLAQHHQEPFVRSGVQEYRDLLVRGNYILHSGVVIRATAYKAVGGYDPSARYACDTIMWLMLCTQGKAGYCAQELFAYRVHGSNMSGSARGVREGIKESLYGIDKSFAVMRGSPEISEGVYKRAVRRNLSGVAEGALFAGDLRGAWRAFWCAVHIHPFLTIFQARTLIMMARVLLGPRGYQVARSILRPSRESAMPA